MHGLLMNELSSTWGAVQEVLGISWGTGSFWRHSALLDSDWWEDATAGQAPNIRWGEGREEEQGHRTRNLVYLAWESLLKKKSLSFGEWLYFQKLIKGRSGRRAGVAEGVYAVYTYRQLEGSLQPCRARPGLCSSFVHVTWHSQSKGKRRMPPCFSSDNKNTKVSRKL